MPSPAVQTPAPWWKFGHVWLIVSGPAIVVLAGLFTFWLAVSRPDPVYSDADKAKAMQPVEQSPALAPAVQARNHAATGGVVAPRR